MKKTYPLIFMIVATCLVPLGFVDYSTGPSVDYAISKYFSALAGYISTMLLFWMLVLGARQTSKFFTNDYSKALKIHDLIGKYGVFLILLHPLLIAIGCNSDILYTINPMIGTNFEIFVTVGRIAIYIYILIWLSSFILRSKIKYRPWKYIHLAGYLMVPLVLLHIPMTGPIFSSNIFVKIYFFIILVGYVIFVFYRLYSWIGFDKFKYNIVSNEKIIDNVYKIILSSATSKSLNNIDLGQYIYISDSKHSESHPFSVTNIDRSKNTIEVIYKTYGKFTKKLSTIQNGAVYLSGPFGDFLNDINHSKKTVFIAGGIGFTPFFGTILENPSNKWLIYANHSAETSVYHNELLSALAGRLFDIISVDKNGNRLIDRNGQSNVLKKIIGNNFDISDDSIQYYLCGPKSQVKVYIKALRQMGILSDQINSEVFNY